MAGEIQDNSVSEPILPPPETWESGIQQAHDLATQVVDGFDRTKTVLKVNPEDRKGGMYTPEEIKLAVGMMVARRMILELKADLMFNTMAVSRARNYMASHPLIPKHEKDRVMMALQVKEGMGVRLSTAWRIMELSLKRWQIPKFWHPGRDPVKEARKLFLAINGLQEVESDTREQAPGNVLEVPEEDSKAQKGQVSVGESSGEAVERAHVPGLPSDPKVDEGQE